MHDSDNNKKSCSNMACKEEKGKNIIREMPTYVSFTGFWNQMLKTKQFKDIMLIPLVKSP